MTEPVITTSPELPGSTSAGMGMLATAEADPSDYLNKLAKHPRLSRMHGIPEGANGEFLYRSKQPRPLEDGNWMCEDPACRNVNYPRRSECNKCGKKRGLIGDTIVKNYVESIKLARGESAPSALQQASRLANMSTYDRGYYPDVMGADLRYSTSEHDAWLAAANGGGLDAPYTPQYATNGGSHSRRSAFTTASEGRRLAEQLLLQFANSSDPVRDARECVAAAALWLGSVTKSRSQADYSHSVSPSSLSPVSSSSLSNLAALSQADHTSPLVLPSAYYGGPNGMTPGMGLNAHVSTLRGVSGRVPPIRPVVSFEDYKDRPSDYLREFGDPAALNAAGTSAIRPLAGVNGNWECDDCKNVNFPRRTNCYQCHKKRGSKGEDIVREYVRRLIEESLRL